MKTILLVEELPNVRDNFIRLIKELEFFKVLTAADTRNAIELVKKVKIDVVIVSRQVNAMEIDILDHFLKRYPNIKLIAMAQKKSKLASLLKAFEYKLRFETPVDLGLLFQTLLSEFEMGCGGQIHGISIASFLQMIELEGKTCVIKVIADAKIGYLYFEAGDLIEAEMDGLNAKAAAFAIMDLENAFLSIAHEASKKERTIFEPLMSLLLESGRIKDERQPEAREKRRYKRYSCALPVTFYHNDRCYTGLITNIGLGGVFLETIHALPIGCKLQIALYSPSLDKGCRINAVVTRCAREGAGIEFLPASIKQMGILRTIILESQSIGETDRVRYPN